jgi:hypothetical protein
VDKLATKLLASCEARSPADFIPKHQHIPPVLAFGKRFPKFSGFRIFEFFICKTTLIFFNNPLQNNGFCSELTLF